jgi:hypothetical protein
MYKWVLILLLSGVCGVVHAQFKDSSIFQLPVQMDEVVVSAVRKGWDVKGFMKRVREDTTFYKAFRSLHLISYTAINDIKVLDGKNKVKASWFSKTKQNFKNGCRTMDLLEEKVTGDFFKQKREYRYYTAQLYASLFFTQGRICNENDIVKGALQPEGKSQLDKNKYRLKQLMFNPGAKLPGVPLMGDKAQIFEPDIAKMYDFKLTSAEYNNEECYVFTAVPKDKYKDDVIYDLFTTWFRKADYAIVQRDYSLSYNPTIYDFDVKMKVKMTQVNNKLLPYYISYDGNWHVFSKKRERVRFTTHITF